MSLFFRAAIAALLAFASLATTSAATASGYLQCVPFARAASGVDIHGNANTWWAQADNRYERGREPRVGAVMHFPGTRAMPIGHVAVVSRIISSREILIDHANWSWRGQIERGVRVVDVSPNNDWSMARVWYGRINDLGLRANPVSGFIYPTAPRNSADSTTIAATVVTDPANG
jgi:surface antigen